MKDPILFRVKNDFSFSKEDCYKYNLPGFFVSVEALSWLDEEKLAKKFVYSNEGVVKDEQMGLSCIIQVFKRLKDTKELRVSLIQQYANYVVTYYEKELTKQLFRNHLKSALDKYSVENAKEQATNNIY
jgi:hypothetical protein